MRHALGLRGHAKVAAAAESPRELARLEDPSQLADILAAHGLSKTIERQAVLEIAAPEAPRARFAAQGRYRIMAIERKLHSGQDADREDPEGYYLTEQMKAIRRSSARRTTSPRLGLSARPSSRQDARPPTRLLPSSAASEDDALFPESTVSRTSRLDDRPALVKHATTWTSSAHEILGADHYNLKKVKGASSSAWPSSA